MQADLPSLRRPSVSADGRFVAFVSLASNLVAGDTNNLPDAFVKDLAGPIVRVSVSSSGAQSNIGAFQVMMSRDAEFVAFLPTATTLTTESDAVFCKGFAPPTCTKPFFHMRASGTTSIVALAPVWTPFDEPGQVVDIAIDDAGRNIAVALNGPLPSNLNDTHVAVFDRVTGATSGSGDFSRIGLALGGDGRHIAQGGSPSLVLPLKAVGSSTAS